MVVGGELSVIELSQRGLQRHRGTTAQHCLFHPQLSVRQAGRERWEERIENGQHRFPVSGLGGFEIQPKTLDVRVASPDACLDLADGDVLKSGKRTWHQIKIK